jgi:hypothetical protein
MSFMRYHSVNRLKRPAAKRLFIWLSKPFFGSRGFRKEAGRKSKRRAINSGSTTLPASDHSLSAMPPTAFAASRPGTQPTSSSLVAKPPLATNPKTVIVRGPLPPEIAVVVCVDDSARMTERWPDVVRPGGYLDKCIEKLMLSVGGGGKVSPAFLACVGGRRRLDRLSKGRGGGRGRLARLANHEAWGTRSPAWRTYG